MPSSAASATPKPRTSDRKRKLLAPYSPSNRSRRRGHQEQPSSSLPASTSAAATGAATMLASSSTSSSSSSTITSVTTTPAATSHTAAPFNVVELGDSLTGLANYPDHSHDSDDDALERGPSPSSNDSSNDNDSSDDRLDLGTMQSLPATSATDWSVDWSQTASSSSSSSHSYGTPTRAPAGGFSPLGGSPQLRSNSASFRSAVRRPLFETASQEASSQIDDPLLPVLQRTLSTTAMLYSELNFAGSAASSSASSAAAAASAAASASAVMTAPAPLPPLPFQDLGIDWAANDEEPASFSSPSFSGSRG